MNRITQPFPLSEVSLTPLMTANLQSPRSMLHSEFDEAVHAFRLSLLKVEDIIQASKRRSEGSTRSLAVEKKEEDSPLLFPSDTTFKRMPINQGGIHTSAKEVSFLSLDDASARKRGGGAKTSDKEGDSLFLPYFDSCLPVQHDDISTSSYAVLLVLNPGYDPFPPIPTFYSCSTYFSFFSFHSFHPYILV